MKRLILPEWEYPRPVQIPDELKKEVHGSKLLLETLVRRGYSDPQKALAFLDPDLYEPAKSIELPDLLVAVQRIKQAINLHQRIGVWGDFDVDGQTSTTVLVGALRHLGADVLYHIPIRANESHGILIAPLKDFISKGIQLIITCDTGISAHEAVSFAKEQGIDVLITDHHSLPEQLPDALAVINPQRLPEDHPLRSLSGVGVAYKLIEQLCNDLGEFAFPPTLLDLVALGMIADMATLTLDTRYLVQRGLQVWRSAPRPSLKKILDENKVKNEEVTEETISFIVAPRLNAIGRLDDANPMVEFLLSDDPVFIATKLNQIEGLNEERKIRCDEVFKGAQAMLEASPRLLERPLILLNHPEWHAGVIGIVASRLVEIYHRPAILLNSSDPNISKGSCRSIEGINITQALKQNRQFLLGFGGHPMAAGLSVETENLTELQFGLIASIKQMMKQNNINPIISIDANLDLEEIDLELINDLSRLSPFGPGNPAMKFIARDLEISDISSMGKNKDHLQVNVIDGKQKKHRIVWWQGASLPRPNGRFDLLFTASPSNYKGKIEVTFEWLDFREIQSDNMTTRNSSKNQPIQMVDLRASTDPSKDLISISKEDNSLIWSEGIASCPLPVFSREELQNCETLAVWSIPPSRSVISSVVEKVKPKKIIWFSNYPEENSLQKMIQNAASVILMFAQGNSESPLTFEHLAASVSITIPVARLLIKWMEMTGRITIISENGEAVQFSTQRHPPDQAQIEIVQNEIKTLHKEIFSFRQYYTSSPSLDNLLDPPSNRK
jgi:single-stranded-DNA-specific exonuclease